MGRRSREAGATGSSELPEAEPAGRRLRSVPKLLGLTLLGALLPGLGLIAGGRRRIGAFILTVTLGLIGLGVYVWLTRREEVLAAAVVPSRLLLISVAIGTVGHPAAGPTRGAG